MNLSIEKYTDINELTAEQWNSYHSGGFYFLHSFLSAVQQACVNDAQYEYLVVKDNAAVICVAVLSSFMLHLDLLAGPSRIVSVLKKAVPKLFRLRVACCGVPVSFGQNHFFVKDTKYEKDALELIEKELARFAKDSGSKLLAWKEFEADFSGSELLQKRNYIKLKSLPDMMVRNSLGIYADFIQSMRSSHRRKFNKTKEKLFDNHSSQGGIRLEIRDYEASDAEIFHKGYTAVIDRTDVKLEIYSEAFFRLLAEHCGHFIKIISVENDKNEKLSALLAGHKKEMHFLLIAKEKKYYSDPLYNELLRAILIYGFQKNYTMIHLGQTSYYSKMDCGALATPLFIYLRSEVKHIQFIIRIMGNILFPATPLPNLHVYKTHA